MHYTLIQISENFIFLSNILTISFKTFLMLACIFFSIDLEIISTREAKFYIAKRTLNICFRRSKQFKRLKTRSKFNLSFKFHYKKRLNNI